MAPLLIAAAGSAQWQQLHRGTPAGELISPVILSGLFALLVWRLRSATPPAAVAGAVICVTLSRTCDARSGPLTSPLPLVSPMIAALALLFVLTFAATRFRRSAKETRGVAEERRGRRAAQIIANLSVAALFAAAGFHAGALAALAEAAADTVSSEIGQALGGPTWMLTTGRRVQPGTDGGISLRGTAAGLLAASLVAFAGGVKPWSWHLVLTAAISGGAGLLFDSLLGATVERRGWLGNDLVNLTSTLFAALLGVTLS